MNNKNDLLDSLNCCIQKVNKKVEELSTSMLIEGEKLEESKQTIGDLISHIDQLIGAMSFLYGQIENMEHRYKCNEEMKKLDNGRSFKYKKTRGDSND
jgi:hypothetical protein